LLAVSGLRISEAIKLDRQDVDFNQALLTIRQTKFNKSRLIPLHVSTRDVLAEYAQRRDRLVPTQSSPCFLLNDRGRCLASSNVRQTFMLFRGSLACAEQPIIPDRATIFGIDLL
jgi:site-specific recombinase XerD